MYEYIYVCMRSERRRSCRNNRNPCFSDRSAKREDEEEEEEEVGTGVLPAVRHLTVTLSSRELRRFRLVLLLISNECSSLVAANPTATNLCVCASAFFRLLYLSRSILVSFCFSLPPSLSPLSFPPSLALYFSL